MGGRKVVIRIVSIMACLLVGAFPLTATAAPLGLTLQDTPNVTSGLLDVSYNASADEFLANGFALNLAVDSFLLPIITDGPGSFHISATIDESGNPSAGTLSIAGGVLGFGPTLLTATLTDFGFSDGGGDTFEFLFTVNGGDLAIPALYGDPGAVVGVILDANGSNFTGSFATDFTNNPAALTLGQGVSQTAPVVPEPATVLLVLLTGVLVPLRRRQRAA